MNQAGAQQQQFNTALLAGTPSGNILAGTQYEYVSSPSIVSMWMAADFTPPATAPTMEVVLGMRRVVPSSPAPMSPGGVAGAGPNTNENQRVKSLVMPGERIQLSYVGGSAAGEARTFISIDPI